MKVFKYEHGTNWYDNYSGFYFINTYPGDDGITLLSRNNTQNCREYFTLHFQPDIRAKNEPATRKAYALITSGYPMSKAGSGAIWTQEVKNSMVILNAFEKHFGISLSKIYPVQNKNWAGRAFIIGSKRWTHSRYSFGMWTLFFRLGRASTFKGATIEKLLPSMKWPELLDRIKNANDSYSTMSQARTVFPKAEAYFDFEKIYLKNRFENWDPDIIGGANQRPEGIVKLVSGNSYAPELKKAWGEFYNDWKKSKQKAV